MSRITSHYASASDIRQPESPGSTSTPNENAPVRITLSVPNIGGTFAKTLPVSSKIWNQLSIDHSITLLTHIYQQVNDELHAL